MRNLAGVPLPIQREAQDALDFFERQNEVGKRVAEILNNRHNHEAMLLDFKLKEPEEFMIGDWVWFHRPFSLTADKALPRWIGPCRVLWRTGMRSYEIEIKPGVGQNVHRSQLKPFRHESMDGPKFPLHYFRLTPAEEVGHEDEWQLERILKHKNTKKGYMFFTKWEGYPMSEATWEPVNHFFHRYSAPFVNYCLANGLQEQMDVLSHLSRRPRGAYFDGFYP